MDPGFGLLLMVLCGVAGVLLLVAVVLFAARLLDRRGDGHDRARSLLHERLASGEIGVDEYYERESALRQAGPQGRAERR